MNARAEAERTPWLGGKRIRAYNPTIVSIVLLVVMISALPLALVDPMQLGVPSGVLFFASFAGALVLRFRALRALRLNNGAVGLMTRGEDAPAVTTLQAAVSGGFGRDVVAMSLHNLGVIALRSLDVEGAIALQRAAVDVDRGFRFRWQPKVATEYARAQLAFALAASGRGANALDEAAVLLELGARDTTPLAIAFSARARALVAACRERFDETIDVLDEERALLRNVLPLNDAVLCEALLACALERLGDVHRGVARAHSPVLADDQARAYVARVFPAAAHVLVS